ncbi:MAG TPA: hypothetical protein DD727_05435 [Clostridiales bacterium]|nr:hypothetical protein [Clostridiales bacterium]
MLTRRSLTYTLSADKNFPDMALFGLGAIATSGSGTLVESYDLAEAPIRIELTGDGERYLIPDPETRAVKWVKYNDTVLGAYEDSPLAMLSVFLGATGGMDIEPGEWNEQGKTLKGTRSQKVSVDAKMEMETAIEFSYILQ